MLVTIDWIRNNFNKYNELFWDGDLQTPVFRVNMSKRAWGRAGYRINRVERKLDSFTLTISNYMDSPEYVKLNTLLHEMIHIADYQFHPEHFLNRRRYDSHGWIFFMPEAQRINKHGFTITPKVTDKEYADSQLSEAAAERVNRKKSEPYMLLVGAVNRMYSSRSGKTYDFTAVKPVGGIPTKKTYQLAENLGMREIVLIRTTHEKFLFHRGSKRSGVYITAAEADDIMKNSEVIMTVDQLRKNMK